MKIRRSLALPGAIPGDSPAIALSYSVLTDEADAEAFGAFIESEAGIARRTEAGYRP